MLAAQNDEHVLINLCTAIVCGKLPVWSTLWQWVGNMGDNILRDHSGGLRFRLCLRDYYLAIRAAHSGPAALETMKGPMGKKRASNDLSSHDAGRVRRTGLASRRRARCSSVADRRCPPPHPADKRAHPVRADDAPMAENGRL